jgi:hypothetical protein
LFEGYWNKVKESIDEGRVHVDDVIASLECHAVGNFDIGAIIGVGASTLVVYICNFRGKWIIHIGVCLAAGIVSIEGGIDGNIGDSSFWRWGTCVFGHICTSTKGDL